MVKNQSRNIIVFDSGIGGLNILNACARTFSELNYIYAADNFNVPYGNKSADEVFDLAKYVLDGAMSFNPEAIVVACNTVTAECIDRFRERYSIPIVGMQPAVKEAAKYGGECAVLVTSATSESDNFKSLLNANFPRAEVCPCPHLAAYIEKNILSLPEKLPENLVPVVKNPDSIVLGCTHYIYLSEQLKRAFSCRVFDGMGGTVRRLGKILGISDHHEYFSGISDHQIDKSRNIGFFNGNISKNKQIFEKIF